jgi:transcriptional regulator with XRE-family HTH domain
MVARFRPTGADAERIEFAKKLTKLLREKEMNQSDLARAIGVSRDAMSTYARGRSFPTHENLRRIATALGVDPIYLQLPIERDPTLIPAESAGDEHVIRIDLTDDGRALLTVRAVLDMDVATSVMRAVQSAIAP